MERTLAIVMAGGAGERLMPLTRERAKPAVPYGGKYRLIDFTLSNCVNSGIRKIFVLTQYKSTSLSRHLQEGWNISSAALGDFVYSMPAQQKVGTDWYGGTADAVRQNLDLIRGKDIGHILILSGDHVYKMDYARMLDYHRAKKAGLTISALRVKKAEAAGRLGVVETDRECRMVGFEEKPGEPKTLPEAPEYVYASMGIYVFRTEVLIEALEGPEQDFGREVIPAMVRKGHAIYVFDYERENRITDYVAEGQGRRRRRVLVESTPDSGYWRDVGTLDSYYQASMDLVGASPAFDLYTQNWPLRTYVRPLPPSKCVLGGSTPESIVSDGCVISGASVGHSVLSPGVVVERGAVVERSVVFDDVVIEPGARVRRAIIDKQARIMAGATIGYDFDADRRRGCEVSESGVVVVAKDAEIGPG